MKSKVHLVLDSAPKYRESFLRILAQHTDLSVSAQDPLRYNLQGPESRSGYRYCEYQAIRFGKLFIDWQIFLRHKSICHNEIFLLNFSLWQPMRLLYFLYLKYLEKKPVVWRGRIIGQGDRFLIVRLFKRFFLKRAEACLSYSYTDAKFISENYNGNSYSFNNTEVSLNEFINPVFSREKHLKILFVGRFQKRKKLERLIHLALSDISIEFVVAGPGCTQLMCSPGFDEVKERFVCLEKLYGDELRKYMNWCDLVVNPGHLGLLVMNAARYGKPIFVDINSEHAPEVEAAIQAQQVFIDFTNVEEVSGTLKRFHNNYNELKELGMKLQNVVKDDYSIEHMVNVHVEVISKLLE